MSWKSPQNREKVHTRKGNVPENTTNPGESTPAKGKCPGNRHKTRRKYNHGKEMSRKSPQNREKVQPQKEKEDNPKGLPSISKKMLQLFAQSICYMSFSHLNTCLIKSNVHNITVSKEQLCIVVIYKFDKV